MKKRLVLAIAGCMPLVATAGIVGENLGLADASTAIIVALGVIALAVARRLQRQ